MKRGFCNLKRFTRTDYENLPTFCATLLTGREDLVPGDNVQMLYFYSTRHQPFIKQVHSRSLTTILSLTEGIWAIFGIFNRKEINTENGYS